MSLYVRVLLSALVRVTSVRDRSRPVMGSLQRGVSPSAMRQNGVATDLSSDTATNGFTKAVLYVFGEKTQVKVRGCGVNGGGGVGDVGGGGEERVEVKMRGVGVWGEDEGYRGVG